MALTDTKTPSASADIVAILDGDLNQVFETARPVKAYVSEISKPMEHPVETGVIITDHRILLPIEIEISLILKPEDFRSVYEQIRLLYINAPFLTVQTKTSSYKNMIIAAMPHEENTDLYDAIPLVLRMKQVQIVGSESGSLPATSVKNPVNQSTINTGIIQPGITQSLPAPDVFESFGPLPHLPVDLPTFPPDAESFLEYEGQSFPVAPMTVDQIQQVITAKGFPRGIP